MKKLYYIANIRMPTERAHGIQIMEMCQAFAKLGYEVELVVPRRGTPITEDPFSFYDIERNFIITKLWCLDTVRFGRIGFWIESLTFLESVAWHVLTKQGLFYTRDELAAVYLEAIGKKVAWEAHQGHTNFLIRLLQKLKTPLVAISEGLRDLYTSYGFRLDRIFVAPDGADIGRFDIDLAQTAARRQLQLPEDKRIVLYKGSLIPWKGAGTLANAAALTKTSGVQFVFIGGTEEDVANFRSEYGHTASISILGNRPRKETPVFQKAADVLVIPNSAKEDISKLYTSPMKLFGYMAGGVPIVASDLPSIKEVLGSEDAYFFTPDDPQNLAQVIDAVFVDSSTASAKAKRALEKVRNYSWDKRAKDILNFLQI